MKCGAIRGIIGIKTPFASNIMTLAAGDDRKRMEIQNYDIYLSGGIYTA